MPKHEYAAAARYYDLFYGKKDYSTESDFIMSILRKNHVRTVLDVGCGTGRHIELLEKAGFICAGLDLNREMLDIASSRVKADLVIGDMRTFALKRRYDAIISFFAAFNFLLSKKDAKMALMRFKEHLNPGGIVILDLHNPLKNGSKTDKAEGVERLMEWKFDKRSRIEFTRMLYTIGREKLEDEHILRIYSIKEMVSLMKEAGFKDVFAYEGYSLKKATQKSKNIVIFGRV